MGGIAGVTPPVPSGGPHPLPPLPQMPLPQGFPNPLEVKQVTTAPPAPPPTGPGTTTITGPQGYMPGIGEFNLLATASQAPTALPYTGASAAAPPPNAFPTLPGQQAPPAQSAQPAPPEPQPEPQSAQPEPQPVTQAPQSAPETAPEHRAEPAQAPASRSPQPHPFWLQLAWQLVQTPAVKASLGSRFEQLVNGEERFRTLPLAASLLAEAELQSALQGLTSGATDQTKFTELFATQLAASLRQQGLLESA